MSPRSSGTLDDSYSHDLLLHDDEATLVEATRSFVAEGLASGGQVLVHGDEARIALMRDALGSHPRLTFSLDRDLFSAPISTLFAYQRALAESELPTQLWATGTVPLGQHLGSDSSWARYESLVNEALCGFAFHGLCTYDTKGLSPAVIAAARATHPCLSDGRTRHASPEYLQPAAFLVDAMPTSPQPPLGPPSVSSRVFGLRDLARVRELVRGCATANCAAPTETIGDFVTAVNEVVANGIVHGAPPVDITLWVDLTSLTCLVDDSGPGMADPLTGYRYPDQTGPMGLWAARQMCGDIVVSNRAEGGCRVLLTS
jgi:anti-sigma regulatory factor (Ser/Thr protein kinase)